MVDGIVVRAVHDKSGAATLVTLEEAEAGLVAELGVANDDIGLAMVQQLDGARGVQRDTGDLQPRFGRQEGRDGAGHHGVVVYDRDSNDGGPVRPLQFGDGAPRCGSTRTGGSPGRPRMLP